MNLGIEYIKYRWNAKNRHGIHSPFLYNLSDKVLKIKIANSDQNILNLISKEYKNSNSIIEIQDFGSGSKKLGNKRMVSDIFRIGSSGKKYGQVLYQLSSNYSPKRILELGTSIGIGTSHLHLGSPNSNLITIEGCKNTHDIAKNTFEKYELKNIDSRLGQFNDEIEKFNDEIFDLIFIDGHHNGDALINYTESLLKHSDNDTIFILDDIRWSDGMFSAWNELKQRNDFHVSVDLFRMGILIKRTQQEKEHFTLYF